MLIDWKGVTEKVTVAVITAGVLAALALLGSNGSLVRALGGVTAKELAEEIAKHPGPAGPPGTPAEVPEGAVIAFDAPAGCPRGWSLVDNAMGTTIVGAFAPARNSAASSSGNLYTAVTNGRPEMGTYYDYKTPGGFVPGTQKQSSPNT